MSIDQGFLGFSRFVVWSIPRLSTPAGEAAEGGRQFFVFYPPRRLFDEAAAVLREAGLAAGRLRAFGAWQNPDPNCGRFHGTGFPELLD